MKLLLFSYVLFVGICWVHSKDYEYCEDRAWLKFNDHCYNFHNSYAEKYRVSYYRAEEKCRAQGAHLVSIHSEEENKFIQDVMRNKYFSGRQWIGLNTLQNDQFQWSDGSPVDYMKVVNKTQYKKEKCYIYYPSEGGWRSDHCQLQYLPLCKKSVHDVTPTTIPPVTTPAPQGNCPDDWLQFGQKCYKYFGATEHERKKFKDAKNACIALGKDHDLVSIHSMEEQAFLTQHLSEWKNSTWIGYSYVESDEIGHVQVFGWTDNSNSDFTYWAPARPTSGTWKYCAMLSYEGVNKGEWIDDYCDITKRSYICARPPIPGLPPKVPEPSKCDDGYIGYRNSCYQYHSTPKAFLDAEDTCKESGGHLVSVSDSSEQAFLHITIPKDSDSMIWNGLSTTLLTGSYIFRWTDKQPFYFSMWNYEQPKLPTDNSAACVAATPDMNLKWNVTSCDLKLPFICETNHDRPPYVPNDVVGNCSSDKAKVDIGDNYCYYIVNDWLAWSGTSRHCIFYGMEMITLSSSHQAKSLMTYIWDKPFNYYLGLIKTHNGTFIWMDHSPMKYSNWGAREPTTWFDKNDCAVISTRDSKWYSKNCDEPSGIICRSKKSPYKS